MIRYLSVLSLSLLNCSLLANISLPAIFGDHMVLQRDAEVTIWGWGKALEPVAFTASWAPAETLTTEANPQGQWSFTFRTPSTSGPYQLRLEGYNTIELDDVLLGEVWLCSGQSNMEWSVNLGIDSGEAEAAQADFPEIRFFTALHKTSRYPQDDLPGRWVKCTPETMRDFSAVGYFFGRYLHQQLDAPVGLILSAWGGTPAEVWTPAAAIAEDPVLAQAAQVLEQNPWCPKDPGIAYNAMLHPLAPYRIAGALWYQGETNTANATTYAHLLSTMIQEWRGLWGYEFPFYYVQIAPFDYGADHINGAIVRDQQRRLLSQVKGTGMVVVSDIGDIDDIHPRNKLDVGLRLARLALQRQYNGRFGLVQGPLYRGHRLEGEAVRVHFSEAARGLVANGPLEHFSLAGADGRFYPAEATIEGETVLVRSERVPNPVHVRFAMENTATPNLFNVAGLPASCFATDLE